jgi:uncharacterized protein involved in exopolysaccharide biosynthesis
MPTKDSKDEVQLLDYLVVLVKHSRLIVYTTLAVMAVTLVVLLLISNKYTAVATIIPPQQNVTLSAQLLDSLGGSSLPMSASGLARGGMGSEVASLLGLKSPADLYVGILTGNAIYDRIIERFNLHDYYYNSWDTFWNFWNLFGPPYIEDVRKKLSKRSDISAGKDGLIKITVTDEDPKRAAMMANAFVEEMDKLLQKIAVTEAKERLDFLEKERTKASHNLAKAEDDLRAFSEQSKLIKFDDQARGAIELIANLRAAIDTKEVELGVLRQRATPYNFDVKRVETELKGLRERLNVAETQSSKLPRDGDVLIATSKIPSLGLEYLRLFRETKYQESLYHLFCKLAELAHLDQVRDVAVVEVVDHASPPEKKSKPKRLLLTALAGVITAFTMIVVAFVLEYWQNIAQSEGAVVCLRLMERYAKDWQQDAYRLSAWLKRKVFRRSEPLQD